MFITWRVCGRARGEVTVCGSLGLLGAPWGCLSFSLSLFLSPLLFVAAADVVVAACLLVFLSFSLSSSLPCCLLLLLMLLLLLLLARQLIAADVSV